MDTLSGQIRTFTKSVKNTAETNDVMMAVVAFAAVAVSLVEILSRGKRRDSRATSSGCKPDAFRHRLVAALSSIPVAAPAGVGK
jgi:hypothetical protein